MGLKSAFLTSFSKLPQPARATKLATRMVVLNACMMISPFWIARVIYRVSLPTPASWEISLQRWRLGACPTLTVLLRRTIRDHLRRARPEKILNVFQRIRLRFFQACGLASGRTSFASSRTAMSDRLLVAAFQSVADLHQ